MTNEFKAGRLSMIKEIRENFVMLPKTSVKKMGEYSSYAATLINVVCNFFAIDKELIFKKYKKREVSFAKSLIMFFLRQNTKVTDINIAEYLQLTNHSSVIYAVRRVSELVSINDEQTILAIQSIENQLLKK